MTSVFYVRRISMVLNQRISTNQRKRCRARSYRFYMGLTLLEILRTLEALARLEVEEVHSLEEPCAVCPSCDVLLILRRLALILVVAEGLHEWIYAQTF